MRNGDAISGFTGCVGQGVAQLLLMADLSRRRDFTYDLDQGVLSFPPDIALGVEVLGIAAEATADWVWGWDTDICDFHESALGRVRELRRLGTSERIGLFTHPRVDISGNLGADEIAMLAACRCGALAWFVIPLRGGWRAYVIIVEDHGALARPGTRSPAFLLRVLERMIAGWDFSQHLAPVEAYLRHERCALIESSRARIVAETPTGEHLTASFDALGRLTSIAVDADPIGIGA